MTFYHYAGIVIGIALLIAGGWQLVREGYDGEYFDEFVVSIVMQLTFVGGAALLVWGLGCFHTAFLIAAGVISFVLPFCGFLAFNIPDWKREKAGKDLRKAVMNGQKYRAYIAFVRKNADRIGAIHKDGTVVFAPGDLPLFVPSDNGYEVSWEWNSALGHPVYGHTARQESGWESKSFFTVREDERQWTWEEKQIIAKLVEESLPGERTRWTSDVDSHVFYLNLPAQTQKKKRRNPY